MRTEEGKEEVKEEDASYAEGTTLRKMACAHRNIAIKEDPATSVEQVEQDRVAVAKVGLQVDHHHSVSSVGCHT